MLLVRVSILSIFTLGAKPHISSYSAFKNKDARFLELKLKKELSDKKLSPLKKYTFAILAARELKQSNHPEKALEFYQIAREIKVDENKTEIQRAFTPTSSVPLFFFEINLKTLLKNKNYERAILSLNPAKLNAPEGAQYRIIYDLLNVKIKKRAVKKLYCFDEYQKNPDDYQYSNLLCDLLIDYLRYGKIENERIKNVEDYFFKSDLKERYLLQLAKDLKATI